MESETLVNIALTENALRNHVFIFPRKPFGDHCIRDGFSRSIDTAD